MSEPIEDCVEYLVATFGDCVRDHTPVGYSSVRDGMGDVLSACGLSQASLWEMVQRFAFFFPVILLPLEQCFSTFLRLRLFTTVLHVL